MQGWDFPGNHVPWPLTCIKFWIIYLLLFLTTFLPKVIKIPTFASFIFYDTQHLEVNITPFLLYSIFLPIKSMGRWAGAIILVCKLFWYYLEYFICKIFLQNISQHTVWLTKMPFWHMVNRSFADKNTTNNKHNCPVVNLDLKQVL